MGKEVGEEIGPEQTLGSQGSGNIMLCPGTWVEEHWDWRNGDHHAPHLKWERTGKLALPVFTPTTNCHGVSNEMAPGKQHTPPSQPVKGSKPSPGG